MSRKSRRDRKLARQHSQLPVVTGNMAERMMAISKRENNNAGYSSYGWKYENGHSIYDPEHDLRGQNSPMTGYSGGYAREHDYRGQSSSNTGANAHLFHVSSANDGLTFHCKDAASEEISGCPIARKTEVYISAKLWGVLTELAGQIDTEWITLLFGKVDESGNYHIDHMYFPPQTASGTQVDIPTGIVPRPGVIGALHSHVRMQAFFSSTDKEHSNWPLEIVLNARGEYQAIARQRLECGKWSKPEAKVLLKGGKDAYSKMRPSSRLEMLLTFVQALERAFAAGKRKRAASQASDDDSAEVDTAPQVAATVSETVALKQLIESESAEVYGTGIISHNHTQFQECKESCPRYTHMLTVPDDGSAANDDSEIGEASLTDCAECEGVGLVDARIGGFDTTEICGKCNGWGKLMDGKPISAGGPAGLETTC